MNISEDETTGPPVIVAEGRSTNQEEELSIDLDDLLEVANLSERKIYDEGFGKGLKDGVSVGREEGWVVGAREGVAVGVELGEAKGFSEELLLRKGRLVEILGVQEEGRVKRLCGDIIALVDEFPKANEGEQDLVRLLEDIRIKDKLLKDILSKKSIKTGDKAVKEDGQKYSL